jgi:putative heme-binding domain-containing protein
VVDYLGELCMSQAWPKFLRGIVVVQLLLCCDMAAAADWETISISKNSPSTDGLAWYRCFIRVPDNMTSRAEPDLFSDSVTLSLGGVPGRFAVYLNGREIAKGDALPDEPRRRFKVPKGILEPGLFNVLAMRVEAKASDGGVRKPPILAGYHDELVLQPQWEMFRGSKVDPTALKPVKEQPKVAAYTEQSFRQSSTPLSDNMESMPGRRMPPEASLALMKTPDDLAVDLMLSEPSVAQPTHLSFDERGRLWVAQYRQYPYPAGLKMISRDKYYRSRFDKTPPPPPHHDQGRDIISVHEDTDGDGKFDKHRNVLTGLNMANAAVRGHGGIWVMHTPYLMFYPDADGNDVPDRDPEVRLAGFGLEDTHSTANGLIWGPDGWLYGAQGSTTTSRITRPGFDAPNFPGVFFEGCMVWRYHPEKKIYEIFAEGGGNNFGLEFDAQGRLFCGNNGGQTRAWHFVQEGVYLKQNLEVGKYGPPRNPYAFGQLPMTLSANEIPRFTHDVIVFEGTALPQRFLGQTIGVDPLHRNLVAAERTPRGSTFQTKDAEVALAGGDIAFRPVYLTAGPDGAVYVADFYEEFIAHGQNYQGQIDPTTGRVFRLRGKDSKLNTDINLAAKTTAQLIKTLSHPNRWHRQTAVRLLGERRDPAAVEPLKALLVSQSQAHPAVEALWALHQMGMLDEATAIRALEHPAGPVRSWVVRLMGDHKQLPEGFAIRLLKLIETEPDPEVRSQIASSSRRLPATQSLLLASAIARRDVDESDPFIPLLTWWAIESHCETNRDAVVGLFKEPAAWNSSLTKQHILPRLMRRFAATGTRTDFLACAELLNAAPSAEHRKLLMSGFERAYEGRALPPLADELVTALAKSGMASPALRVRLGDKPAITEAIKAITDRSGKVEDLLTTITLLGEVKVSEAIPVLLAVVRSDTRPPLRKAALTSLLRYDDETIGPQVASFFADLPAEVRPAAQNLLASQPAWTVALLKLIDAGTIKASEVPPDVVMRLKTHEDPAVVATAERLFPGAAPTDRETKLAEEQRIRRVIESAPGDPYQGEAIFMQRCAACHTLFFKGGNIGPNLTTYQRDDLGTMLVSILDPNAEVREGYASYIVRTKSRRALSGFLVESDPARVVLRGTDGQNVGVPRADIADMKVTGTSLMPEGLLSGLDDQQIRDFFAYLRISQPITR